MTVAAAVVLVVLAIAREASAQESLARAHPLRLTGEELMELLESPPTSDTDVEGAVSAGVMEYFKTRKLGLRPVLTLIPGESEEGSESKPPAFALVARAEGRTLVSVTRPGAKIGPGDSVLLQRMLVSDLLRGRRYSLTVYKDHALDENALRFLGVGARLLARPALKLFGWRLRVQLFGSYHPSFGGTGYLAVSGSQSELPIPASQPAQ